MTVATANALSADSGEHWATPGAWEVSDGIHRIPLPLPNDGLKAVNVYAIETGDGLALIDGGWAIAAAREALAAGLKQIGRTFVDIRCFLVTHVHRDHYTLAASLGTELGVDVTLGIREKPALDAMMGAGTEGLGLELSLRQAGALEILDSVIHGMTHERDVRALRYPDTWLDGDVAIGLGERTVEAVHTPGHTKGHYVFVEAEAGLLFTGDHVLPTITPSIGFEAAPARLPLADFMTSLAKVRTLPDLRLLPAHGPIADSTHARVDELLAHHEERLAGCRIALADGARTAFQVAGMLPWTRHAHAFDTLDPFNAALAAMETKAHLDVLVSRELATCVDGSEGAVFTAR